MGQEGSATPLSVIDSQEGQHEFQQLMQHNTTANFPHEPYILENSAYVRSGTNSSYGTPEPGNLLLEHFGRGQNGPSLPHYGGLEQTDEYGTPMYYPNPPNGHTSFPPGHQTPYHNYYISSPPTPAASDQSSNGKRKRDTRSLAPNRSVGRASPSPRPKRSKQNKGEKAKVPKIEAPLSVLTQEYDDVPVKDMNAWVNRPVEVRQAEVEKRKGKITRPMNSFMLYRSAYADRTKIWCLQNNHQVVSSVSGESWPMEPKEIRDLYTEYARIERDNHQKAHPGYKFSPSKAGTAGRKRRDASDDEDEEPSDLDDLDAEWKPSRARSSKVNVAKRTMPEASWPNSGLPYSNHGNLLASDPFQSRSSYHYSNPGKPLPAPMTQEEMYGQYYQTSVRANAGHPYTEDVFYHRAQTPGQAYGSPSPLVGIPGHPHYELYNEQSVANSPATLDEPQVDPYLLNQDDDAFAGLPAVPTHVNGLNDFDHPNLFDTDTKPATYQDDPTFTQGMEGWQFGENTSPGIAATSFDKWMEQTEDS